MIKMMFGIKRLPHLTAEEFHIYWKEKHGVLAKKLLPGLHAVKYIQSHTLDLPVSEDPRGLQGMKEPFDGVVEIWWESIDVLMGTTQTLEGKKAHEALIEDEKIFIDFSRSAMWFVQEEVFIE